MTIHCPRCNSKTEMHINQSGELVFAPHMFWRTDAERFADCSAAGHTAETVHSSY